jgi:hypothetical protein
MRQSVLKALPVYEEKRSTDIHFAARHLFPLYGGTNLFSSFSSKCYLAEIESTGTMVSCVPKCIRTEHLIM